MKELSLLKLRMYQFLRIFSSLGIVYSLFFCIFFICILIILNQLLLKISILEIFTISIMVVIMIHFTRKDINFLEKITNSNKELKKIIFFENIIIMSILILFLLYISLIQIFFLNANIDFLSFLKYLIPLLSSFAVYILPFEKKIKNKYQYDFNIQFIPYKLFELKYLLRKYTSIFILIILLSFASCFHIFFTIITFLISLSIILNYTQFNEPKEILHIKNVKKFLFHKIIINNKYFALIIVPVCLLSIFFHINYWLLIIYIFISFQLTITFLVIYKYSVYDSKISINQNFIPITVFFLFLIVPAGILVNFMYCIYYFPKSINNIKNELIN
jgi:hypothetical protein